MMELDELKTAWLALDKKLIKNEILKETIIKEMLQSTTNKALKRLSNHEWMITIVTFLGMPFLIYMFNNHLDEINPKVFLMFKYLFIVAIISLFIHCPIQIWKLCTLMKIDFSDIISKNIRRIEQFNILIKRERIYSWIMFAIISAAFIISFIIINFSGKDIWRPIFIITMLVFALIRSIWVSKKTYDANIQSIKKSLEELKELQEE